MTIVDLAGDMKDLDGIIKELGQFGKYQVYTYFLLFFPLAFSAIGSMTYIFTTGDISYRCRIPECEGNGTGEPYREPWVGYAVPFSDSRTPERCSRYRRSSEPAPPWLHNCSASLFTKEVEPCAEHVFETDEVTITKEFNLLCAENDWKRTMIGTLNNIAQFIAMPIAGVVSDKFGRKTMIVTSVVLSAIFGTLRSFSTSYVQFVILEMLDAMAYSGVYSGVFVFGIEIIGPDKRGIGGAVLSVFYSIGEIILGLVVWYIHDWRQYLRVLYVPGLFFFVYFWVIPESIRWLVAHGKNEKVAETFTRMARLNNKPLSDHIKKIIENLSPELPDKVVEEKVPIRDERPKHSLREVLKSKKMILRILNCAFCWMTHTFVFYGLSLNSVSIAGHKYINFILVSFVEIPAYALAWIMVDRCGRKLSLCLGLATAGLSCTSFYFVSPDSYTIRLILFLTGKLAITESFTTLYVLASEIYPTGLRHSLLGFCSTLGRFGSMIAPQTPLMARFIDPVLMFGAVSFVAAALGLCFPETKGCAMPETIEEAENLGRSRRSHEQKRAEANEKR